jgi:hypothetical protein
MASTLVAVAVEATAAVERQAPVPPPGEADGNDPDGKDPDGNDPKGNDASGNDPDAPDGSHPDGSHPDGSHPDGEFSDGRFPNCQEAATGHGDPGDAPAASHAAVVAALYLASAPLAHAAVAAALATTPLAAWGRVRPSSEPSARWIGAPAAAAAWAFAGVGFAFLAAAWLKALGSVDARRLRPGPRRRPSLWPPHWTALSPRGRLAPYETVPQAADDDAADEAVENVEGQGHGARDDL